MSEPLESTVIEVQEQLARVGLGGTREMAREMANIMADNKPIEPDPNLIPNPERHRMRPVLHQREAGGTMPPTPPQAENLGPWTGGTTPMPPPTGLADPRYWREVGRHPVATTATEAAQPVRTTGTPITLLRSLYRQLEAAIAMMDREQMVHHVSRGVGDGEFMIGDFLITSRWPTRARPMGIMQEEYPLPVQGQMEQTRPPVAYDHTALQTALEAQDLAQDLAQLQAMADATMTPLTDPVQDGPF